MRVRRKAGGFHPDHFSPGWGDGGFHPPNDAVAHGRGGGGVISNEFSPLFIPALVDWHRSDLGITLVGSNVSAWADQSGQAHDLAQGTDSLRAIYTSGVINGHPVLRFDRGADGAQYSYSSGWAQSTDATIYAVVRHVTTAATQIFLGSSDGTVPIGPRVFVAEGGSNPNKPTIQDGDVGAAATSSTALSDATSYLIRWRWSFLGASSVMGVRVNNAAEATVVPSSEGLETWNLLGVAFDLLSFDFVGDLAEFFIVAKEVSAAEDSQVRAYVSARYGIVM